MNRSCLWVAVEVLLLVAAPYAGAHLSHVSSQDACATQWGIFSHYGIPSIFQVCESWRYCYHGRCCLWSTEWQGVHCCQVMLPTYVISPCLGVSGEGQLVSYSIRLQWPSMFHMMVLWRSWCIRLMTQQRRGSPYSRLKWKRMRVRVEWVLMYSYYSHLISCCWHCSLPRITLSI